MKSRTWLMSRIMILVVFGIMPLIRACDSLRWARFNALVRQCYMYRDKGDDADFQDTVRKMDAEYKKVTGETNN